MHAYLWIVVSWVVVAVACYFWLGITSNNNGSRGQPSSGIAGSSGEWFNQVLRWMWQSRTVSHTFFDILVRALNESKRRVNTAKLGANVVDVVFEAPPPAHLVILRRVKRQAADSSTPDGTENEPPYLENIRANTIGSNNVSVGGSGTNSEHLVINARLVVPQKLTLRICVTRNEPGSATNAAMAQLNPAGTTASVNQQKCFYEFTVHQMRGDIEARLAQIADELFIMGCFSGRPEMSTKLVELPPTSVLEKVPVEELEELARKCLLSVVFSFSVGELLYPESARNSVRLSTEIRNLSMMNELYPSPPEAASNFGSVWSASSQSNKVNGTVNVDQLRNYDAAWDSQRGGMLSSTGRKAPNRIRVRLIGARGLGQGQKVRNPYATVELDDPSQKFVSAKPLQQSQNNNNNPQWDETFEIGINANSKELLFEVYDDLGDGAALHCVNGYDYENDVELTGGGGRKKFLGLAIVGLDELSRRWEAVEHSGSGNLLVEPFVHQLCLQAHPCGGDARDGASATAQQKNSGNIISGVLLIQCEFLTLSGSSQFPGSALKFPVGELPSRGKLTSAATPSYLYNSATDPYGSANGNIAEIGSTPSLIAAGPPPKSPGSPSVVTFQKQHFDNRSPSASLHYSLRDSEAAQQAQREYFVFDRDVAVEAESGRQRRSASRSSANNVTNQSGGSGSQIHIHHQHPVSSSSPYDRYGVGASSPGMSASSSRAASQSSVVMNTTFAKQQQPRSAYRTASEGVAMAADDGRSSASGGGSGEGGNKQRHSKQHQHWVFSATNAASTLALGSAGSGFFAPPSAQQLQPPVEGDLTVLESTTVAACAPSPPPPPIPLHHPDATVVADRQREASASPKRGRAPGGGISFFDDLRARLSRGSLSRRRRAEKRAKSLDERSQAPGDLEEANVSMPASRDHSQVRYGLHNLSQSQVGAEAMSLTESQQTGTGTHLSDGGRQSVLLLELSADEGGSSGGGGKIRPEKYRCLNSVGVEGDVPPDEYGADFNQLLIDNGSHPHTLRYYVIPAHLVDEPACQRLIRAGKKLHIFNNHTFVAVKPRGSVQCSVCGRIIVGNFTKQAYQCRDCRTVTHKSCHVRSASPCPNSNLANLQIIDNVDWVDFLKQNQMQEFISMNGV